MQLARTETEAYDVLKRHLEGSVANGQAVVLNRNNSANRLEPRTELPPESRLAESLLPAGRREAARWSVAVMELGALVCTAARPRCTGCPLALDTRCARS